MTGRALHPAAVLVEFVAGDDRIDVLARPRKIDVRLESVWGDRLGIFAAGPALRAARAGVVFRERKRNWVGLVLPMLDRPPQIPRAGFEIDFRIEQFFGAKIIDPILF